MLLLLALKWPFFLTILSRTSRVHELINTPPGVNCFNLELVHHVPEADCALPFFDPRRYFFRIPKTLS